MGKKKKSNQGPPPPQPRDLTAEINAISAAAGKNAKEQTDQAIRANSAFQIQADQSVQNIASNLGEGGAIYEQRWIPPKTTGKGKNKKTTEGRWEKVAIGEASPNKFTAAAKENLAGAQTGVDQVQSAQTGLGQLRDQYAAQGQDPAMQRLNAMAVGQLYRPDQIQAGQVAADQVTGSRVADVGSMPAAQAQLADQVRARNIRAAQAGPVNDVSASSVGGIERVAGTQVSSVAPMQAARIARTQDVSSRDIRASAAERALMNEVRGNGLLGQLQSQASSDLALGRSLSAEQSRDAAQAARAGMAARGLGTGNSALAAEMLNRDRFASQRENERRAFAGNVLNQGTGIQQAANQAYAARMEGNTGRELQAGLANQSVAANRAIQQAQLRQQANLTTNQNEQQRVLADAGYAQQAELSNQDFGFRASSQDAQLAQQAALANQQAGLTLGQTNAQLLQQARMANQDASLRANLANQSAFNQQSQFNAGLNQQANAATFEAAQQRAMANAGYDQQANLANQSANLNAAQYNVGQDMAAQQANQQANQTQEQYNRAFLGQVAGMNFDQNQARTSMLSGLYGQQAGLGQTTAALQQGMAQSQVALDPYQRALGSNMPIATIGPSTGLIGQAYGQTMNYGSDLFNTNTNMQASMYNSFQNNQASLRGAAMQAGATASAGQSSMMGSGMAAGGMVLGMTALAI